MFDNEYIAASYAAWDAYLDMLEAERLEEERLEEEALEADAEAYARDPYAYNGVSPNDF
jgi:hypothetical protein